MWPQLSLSLLKRNRRWCSEFTINTRAVAKSCAVSAQIQSPSVLSLPCAPMLCSQHADWHSDHSDVCSNAMEVLTSFTGAKQQEGSAWGSTAAIQALTVRQPSARLCIQEHWGAHASLCCVHRLPGMCNQLAAVQNSRCSICPSHTACQFSAQPILNANKMLEAGRHIPLAVFAAAGMNTRPLTEVRVTCR